MVTCFSLQCTIMYTIHYLLCYNLNLDYYLRCLCLQELYFIIVCYPVSLKTVYSMRETKSIVHESIYRIGSTFNSVPFTLRKIQQSTIGLKNKQLLPKCRQTITKNPLVSKSTLQRNKNQHGYMCKYSFLSKQNQKHIVNYCDFVNVGIMQIKKK
ncbi:hypothetical protein FKM82_010633 [Ascaphus truei]